MKKIILGVVLLLILAAAGAVFYLKTTQDIVLDSAAVEAQAAEILPGARPPKGLKGVLALSPEEDIRIVVFAPDLSKAKPANLKGQDMRIVIALPKAENPDIQVIKQKLSNARDMKKEEMDILSEMPAMLSVGGKSYPGMRSEVAIKGEGSKLSEDMTILMKGQQPVVLLFMGPAGSYNEAARDEFLAGLEAPKMPDKLPGGLQMPEGKPEMPKVPVAGETPSTPPVTKQPRPPKLERPPFQRPDMP